MTLNDTAHRLLYAGLVATLPLLATVRASAAPPSPATSETEPVDDANARARAAYRKGSDAYEAGKLEEAREAFLEAWSLRPTYDVASALGQVELKLQHYRDAAEHLAYCLNQFGPSDSQQFLDQVRKGFAAAKAHVAAVKVTTNRDGAEIYVDGLRVGIAPVSAVVFVEPGPRTLTARLNGETAEQALPVEAGKDYDAQLMFGATSTMKAVPPVSSGLDSPNPRPTAAGQRSIVPLIVGSTVTAAGLGMFVAFRLSASSDHDTVNRLSKAHGDVGCSNPSQPSDCQTQYDAAQSYDRKRDWSTAGLAIAATSAVATAAFYLFWPSGSEKSAARAERPLRVSGSVGSGAASVSIMGAF